MFETLLSKFEDRCWLIGPPPHTFPNCAGLQVRWFFPLGCFSLVHLLVCNFRSREYAGCAACRSSLSHDRGGVRAFSKSARGAKPPMPREKSAITRSPQFSRLTRGTAHFGDCILAETAEQGNRILSQHADAMQMQLQCKHQARADQISTLPTAGALSGFEPRIGFALITRSLLGTLALSCA